MAGKSASKKASSKTSSSSVGNEIVTHVAIVLDRSGSMDTVREATVKAFNEQVEAIRDSTKDQKATVSLVTFATVVDSPAIWAKNPLTLKPLTMEDYVPNGNTSLFDAVGSTITDLRSLPDADTASFLVLVISDGQENHSSKFTGEKLATLISECQDTDRWTFTYIGANQDLSQVSKQLGISQANTLSFQSNTRGVQTMSAQNATATSTYFASRAAGATSSQSFYSSVSTPDPSSGSSQTAQVVASPSTGPSSPSAPSSPPVSASEGSGKSASLIRRLFGRRN